MDSGKSDYVPRRSTPIGDPNNLLDNDSIGLDESEIKRNMLTSKCFFSIHCYTSYDNNLNCIYRLSYK